MCRREKLAAINSVLVLMVYTEMCRKEGVTAINSYTDICNQLCTGIDGIYCNVQEGRSYCNQFCVDGKYHGLNA